MMIDELITQIGSVIGLPTLKLDERGLACVRIQDAPDLNLEYDEAAQCLHLYSVVGTVGQHSPAPMLTSLLVANAFGARTGGSTLGIDDLNGDLVLATRIETSQMPPTTLLNILERFVHNASNGRGASPTEISMATKNLPPAAPCRTQRRWPSAANGCDDRKHAPTRMGNAHRTGGNHRLHLLCGDLALRCTA